MRIWIGIGAGVESRRPRRPVMHVIAWAIGFLLVSTTPTQTKAREQARPGESSATQATSSESIVVLISLDGTRPADLTPERLPSLLALAKKGAIAEGLTPVDPTNTFPNHVSLATGVRPEVHRLVNNEFIDPERGEFKRKDPNAWIESEPIWSIAERHGVKTVSFFWVGSEGPWQGGPGPSETRAFSMRTLEKTKVDQILKWLSVSDPSDRPRLITAWFHGADDVSHEKGPDSEEVTESLEPQDRQIARLIKGMETRGLFAQTTLIFVSDHGLVEAPLHINLTKILEDADLSVSVIGDGGFSSIVFKKNKRTATAIAQAVHLARQAGLEAWPREEAPSDWYVDDPRFGDVVVHAPIGVAIVRRTTDEEGFHGYAAKEPAMAGLLVARGRGVTPGTQLGRVSGLAIAPTVMRLLNLPIPEQMKEPPIAGLIQGLNQSAAAEEAAN